MHAPYCCPQCDVDLDDDGTEVRCWKCGWSVRNVDNPHEYYDRADAIQSLAQHQRNRLTPPPLA
ncbi:hypothetical protein [Nocardia farcinica]|uniref:hypothetical protein n=1 Tax=Nocardia farcinica TaxID=37329 RepID=UPI0024573B67|nr:hypothetical protein [Nocardia farcinica]